jgi:hypothetical protein
VRNDGIEDSTSVLAGPYYVTEIPSCTISNGVVNTDLDLDFADYFSNKITVTFAKDEGYTQCELSLFNQSGKQVYNKTASNTTATFTIDASVPRDNSYTIKVRPKASKFVGASLVSKGEKKRVLLPKTGDTDIGGKGKIIYPYTDGNKNLAFLNFFNTTNPDDTALKKYGMTTSADLILKANYGGTEQTITKEGYSWSSLYDPSTCHCVLSSTDWDTLFTENSKINKNSSSSTNVNMTLSFSTVFGDVISTTFTQPVCFVSSDTKPAWSNDTVTCTLKSPPKANGQRSSSIMFLCQGSSITLTKLKLSTIYHKITKI